jgi:hypothetical protein
MKETEVKLGEEGFEELRSDKGSQDPGTSSGGSNRPDMRVVQADRDKEGNVVYSNVGGMWRNISKNGNEFYTLRIGQLKLLVFPNDRK